MTTKLKQRSGKGAKGKKSKPLTFGRRYRQENTRRISAEDFKDTLWGPEAEDDLIDEGTHLSSPLGSPSL